MTPIFQNYREDVDRMIGAALAAVDPGQAVRRAMRREGRVLHVRAQRFDLERRRVFIVATGKAAVPMAQAAARIVASALTAGVVIGKNSSDGPISPQADSEFPQLTIYQAAHPVPDQSSVLATTAVLDMLAETTATDVVLCLISGGSSALLTQPRLPLPDLQVLTQKLLHSGCTINELNCVRTQLDEVKGGGLAQAAFPSACMTLILSDVIGNPLSLIGSGPTIPATSDSAMARAVLQKYGLLTAGIEELLASDLAKNTAVSPPPPAQQLRVPYVIGDVREAALGALQEAKWMGFTPQLITYHLEGEAREAGRFAASLAKSMPPGHAYVLGGETTVTIDPAQKPGLGSRNLELALSAAVALESLPNTAIATFATDGDDGPTGTAGAIVTGETIKLAQKVGLNPASALAQHDSGTFFQQLDAATAVHHPPHLTITGPTGTNVNDLIFVLKYIS
jgi:glycerate 2-kinase